MLLTDNEMSQIRRSIEAQAGLNQELLHRCGDLIHIGSYDEAVLSACVFLEERLRKAAHNDKLMGVRLAEYAFHPDTGTLAKHLARPKPELKGLCHLFTGAFQLFRNPAAHGAVGYSSAEAKAILGFINLLLTFLDRVEELPPPGSFPESVERAVEAVEQKIGEAAASRLRVFLGKCRRLGLEPEKRGKVWVPFKQRALSQLEHWDSPRSHPLSVFYVVVKETWQGIWFPVNQYYSRVIDLEVEQLSEDLRDLGFLPSGPYGDFYIGLKAHNDQAFFDALFDLIERTSEELAGTLR